MASFNSYRGSETHIRIDPSVTSIPHEAFFDNDQLVEVELPDNIQSIGGRAFTNCCSLTTIHLCEGLQTIGYGAFLDCTSLRQVTIPSTVSIVHYQAFRRCTSLVDLHLCDGLQIIGSYAFYDCTSLHRVTIPSTISVINKYAFCRCSSLKEIQFFEGLRDILEGAFYDCMSLMHINIPSTVHSIESEAFKHCSLLRNVAISPSSTLGDEAFLESFQTFQDIDCKFDMIKSRFDDLPLHKACFDHSHQLMESINRGSSADFLKADCLGMTPLHVLACSGMHDLELYRRIYEICPRALFARDKWGDLPLAYIILSEAPKEVLHFFLEMHRRNARTILLDFSVMINRLAKFTSGKYMRQAIQAQRICFPDLEVEWDSIGAGILRDFQEQNNQHDQDSVIHHQTVRVILEASVSRRSACMSLEHQVEIDNAIERRWWVNYEIIRQMVIDYAQLYHNQMIGATTILEMTLWKLKLNEALQMNPNMTVDNQELRGQSRSDSGKVCNVVIPNVLLFLY
ncbi:hypothetical protein ACHAWU_009994 [Discostella pseudostelligera]|uniref:Uncharacterized protein n=1 Tax=Discostella pseudostelligera TaxID=259834 RepID=A0ABD3N2Z7_9STRA